MEEVIEISSRCSRWTEVPDNWQLPLLRPHCERPRGRHSAHQRDDLAPPHSTPRSTRMPEYQMSHTSTKAFAAVQIAKARDVGCGVKGCPPQPAQTASIRVCCTTDSRHASGGRAELRFVPTTVLCICNKVCEQKAVTRSPHRRGGTAIPRAFAVLMIINLYLLGACTGRSAGFSFAYVSRGMPELGGEIAAVEDQADN